MGAIAGFIVLYGLFHYAGTKQEVERKQKTEAVRVPTKIEQATAACNGGMKSYYDRGFGFECPTYERQHQEGE